MTETATETVLEVFIPGPGENPEDPQDMERSIFLGAAQEALDSGVEIEVYSTDSYPSAFEECAPVAEQIEMNGREVLPLMLVNGEVKVSFTYPTAEQIKRFSRAHMVSQPKANAAAAAWARPAPPWCRTSAPWPSPPVLRPPWPARPPSRWAARTSATA